MHLVQDFLILKHAARPVHPSCNRLLWNGSANSSVAQLGTDLLLMICVFVCFCVVLEHSAGALGNPSNNRTEWACCRILPNSPVSIFDFRIIISLVFLAFGRAPPFLESFMGGCAGAGQAASTPKH